MNLLKNLLDMHQAASPHHEEPSLQIHEARGDGDFSSLLDKWMEATNNYSFEGSRGRQTFESLVGVLGYDSMNDFFDDNSGAYQALIEWMGSVNSSEWEDKLTDFLGDDTVDD